MSFNETELLKQLMNPSTREKAFSTLVNQYGESLYWKIRHIVLFHEDADDVLQNAFIKIWTHIDTFQQQSKLSTWLYRIAINEALDFLRRKKENISIGTEGSMSVASRLQADEWFNGDEAQAKLQEAIATLPEMQRTVFTMRYYNEMKYSDLSQILGTSEGALKANYHLAVKKIKNYLEN